jgi:HEAT repeat protein
MGGFGSHTRLVPVEMLVGVAAAVAGLVENPEPAVRAEAAKTLFRLGRWSPDAVGAIAKTMKDADDQVRWISIQQVIELKLVPPPEVLAAVERALEDPSERVRERAARALELSRERSEKARSALESLRSSDPRERLAAMSALKELGRAAVHAVPALLLALDDSDPTVRRVAALALGATGAEPGVVDRLARALTDPEAWVREVVAKTLGGLGCRARAAEEALTRATQDRSTTVQNAARQALDQVRG